MTNCTNTINIVVYGTNEDDARNLVQSIVGATEERGVFLGDNEGISLKGYIRYIGCSSNTIPIGVTDIVVIHTQSGSDESFPTLQKYVEERALIPVRLIVSSDESISAYAQEKGILFTTDESSVRGLVLSKIKEYRETLLNLYNKHAKPEGLDEEGFKNLIAEYSEGVEGSHESYLFGRSYITFSDYYNWWIMGRNDYYYYKGIDDFNYGSKKIYEMIENNKVEIKNICGKQYRGKLDISPVTEFVNGFKVGINSSFGEEFDKVAQGFSNPQLSSPLSFTLEIGVQDPSKVPEMINKLKEIKQMVKEMLKPVSYFIKSGVDVQFRNVENRFFVDVVVSGLFGQIILSAFPANFSLSSLQFSGSTTFSFSTAFSPVQLIKNPLEEIIRNAVSLSLQGSGNFMNTGTISSVISFLFSLSKPRPLQQKEFEMLLSGLQVLKNLGFDLKYDSLDLFQTVSELAASQVGVEASSDAIENLQPLSQMFAQQQQMFGAFIEQGKAMIGMISDYLSLITNLNLDNISVSASSTLFRAHVKAYLELPGITEFINQTFLQ